MACQLPLETVAAAGYLVVAEWCLDAGADADAEAAADHR